ncbi:MAG: hypothetical protein GXP27_04210 [Planctomycetes bacterium]|nr:hypothetical protein [Planctomycetota bacterium]
MALEYFWCAICSQHLAMAFVGFMTAMESLLTTQSTEITHNLAERAAILLGPTCECRVERYRQVKNLYRLRSRIVHGKVFAKRGPIHSGSLFVGPKFSNVPRKDLQSVLEVLLSLLRSVFRRPAFLAILQTKKKEDKVDRELDEYFLKQILR